MAKVDPFTKLGKSRRSIIANLSKAWQNSTDAQRESGAQWYGEANQIASELAISTGYSIETVAAVIAHLSPRVHWVKNIRAATQLLLTGEAPGMLSACVNRAKAAMLSDDPLSTINGPKTKAFAQAILNDSSALVMDVWAYRGAMGIDDRGFDGDAEVLGNAGVYKALADCYAFVARKYGVSNSTMQATVWVYVRGKVN